MMKTETKKSNEEVFDEKMNDLVSAMSDVFKYMKEAKLAYLSDVLDEVLDNFDLEFTESDDFTIDNFTEQLEMYAAGIRENRT